MNCRPATRSVSDAVPAQISREIEVCRNSTALVPAYELSTRAELIAPYCGRKGKGGTSTLPLAAVLGPSEVLDVLPPAEVTTTHAGHPLSCSAALANLDLLESEDLVVAARETGEIVRAELRKLQARWPQYIADVCGLGLLNAVHFCSPETGELVSCLARDVTFEAVRRGVMLFQVNRPSIKICPPLVIPTDAAIEGVQAIGEAIASVLG